MAKVVINNCYGGYELSAEAIKLYIKKLGKMPVLNDSGIDHYYVDETGKHYFDILRHDKLLIEVVEALGDGANGGWSRLKIIEIFTRFYKITSYDGLESVQELSIEDFIDSEE